MFQKGGVDIQMLKGKSASRFDLYKNTQGDIYKMQKRGRGMPDETGLNIFDF